MTYLGNATVIGSIGVSLLLIAFFLNLFKFLRSESYWYMVLNLMGGALACYSSYLINFMPFVLLESTWASVAAVGVVRKWLGRPAASDLPVS
jgi:multisubunit Na+/H+ antiporter MnhB subunit